ncbi:MAG: 3-dehydroquinate dehydratase [Oceanicoccus sp.]|jgi:3-dehydroquinate dehydratase
MTVKRLLILNGPGLTDIAAVDQPLNLQKIEDQCTSLCLQYGVELSFRQSDEESQIASWITEGYVNFDAIIINPAFMDIDLSRYEQAIVAADSSKPMVEVRLNNIYKASAGKAKPLQLPAANLGFIAGLGGQGYLLAINALLHTENW